MCVRPWGHPCAARLERGRGQVPGGAGCLPWGWSAWVVQSNCHQIQPVSALRRCLHAGKGWLCRAGSSRGPEASAPAVGVSRPRRDCENNSWAGHCGCILLLPRSPCLLAFVWVSSCSDLPLSVLLALAFQSQRFCARGWLRGARAQPERPRLSQPTSRVPGGSLGWG